ncbi:MAG: 3-deoxy-manno-octulosonate cytidylyltransferase [Xanthomonadales bacterium]|nr:3-deoxy-manno-octulosonate cytidylyltransferase [Gammaproteobacteria bacterium]MBT8052784.1 3-deoxy-manno-octulosonate cytidylyltransferase [Gammaproteobacteria bacterium]NND56153.1 3-deoxy-manno-octulosonate cytidylyltransferase [Xanthomonadales bacterium]NNK50558.1 3-deoxy-manno-octulosonate cytidylyltransferase [Xanthomonadales bacterium]
MNAAYRIVIPARMASERLPGKPLLKIGGRTLIEHVYRRACESSALSVVVATDSDAVRAAVAAFGGAAELTSTEHQSGTDRISECVEKLGWPDSEVVVNLQGDEPLMPAACLDQAAGILQKNGNADVASLYWPIGTAQEVEDSNVVKVVLSETGEALYFSRSVIPYPRNLSLPDAMQAGAAWNRHIGLYAYRVRALKAFTVLPVSTLEGIEKLEQLRFLEAGKRITMEQACSFIPAGVDTPEDLERVRKLIPDTD